MKPILNALLVLLTVSPLAAAQLLRIHVDAPARVVDGERIHAKVMVETGETARIAPLEQGRNVMLSIRPIRDDHQRRCVSHEARIPSEFGADEPALTITRHAGAALDVDVLDEYPLGLPPGEYELTAAYAGARSAPVRFTVVAPADAENGAYREFATLCAALVKSDRTAAAPALTFALRNPQFPYVAGLLQLAARRSEGATRRDIDAYLVQHFQGTAFAADAALDEKTNQRRDAEVAAAEAYRAEAAQRLETADPDEVLAFQRLGSIVDANGFAAFEQFLAKHPRSEFAPDVLYAMLGAAEQGILPGDAKIADRDAVVQTLRGRLVSAYPRSFRAQQVARSPHD